MLRKSFSRRSSFVRGRTTSLMVGFAIWAIAASVLLPAQPTAATLGNCSLTEQVFARSTSTRDVTRGTWNQFVTKDRTLDTGCQAAAVSTAHIEHGDYGTADWGKWVEIGWQKIRNGDGSISLCLFWEAGTDPTAPPTVLKLDCNAPLVYGNNVQWKVKNNIGTNNWEVAVNYLDGGGWHVRDTISMAWDHGLAFGETERKGNGTGMLDTQSSLQYMNNNGNWVLWPGNSCSVDTSGTYSWQSLGQNVYQVYQGNNACV
jgi:hypothetical protein